MASGSSGNSSGMSAEDQMRDEIARLTATINQHKYGSASGPSSNSYNKFGYGHHGGYSGYRGRGRGRGATTMGNSGPHKQYVRPGLVAGNGKGKESAAGVGVGESSTGANNMIEDGSSDDKKKEMGNVMDGKKEVVIGGIAFEASKRSLVRKDLPKPKTKVKKTRPPGPSSFMRKGPQGHLMSRTRAYKPKGRGRNMTLDNTNRTYAQSKKTAIRKIDKPCSRFTKTGTCSRGLTCPYEHDPNKIAICWKFMQGDCPNNADTCNLSHNPTPERTPLCVHFLNRGRCTKEKCLFPHVNVGKKEGVCKDFAVLGYCEKGVDCDKNHVRECPEFEETGECRTKGCKLPHVIKANAKWAKKDRNGGKEGEEKRSVDEGGREAKEGESGELGDEYISLIFNESESESESEGGEGEDEGEGENEEEEEEQEEGEDSGSEIEMEVHV